jgi:uncharacterized membrane protein YciS (DUF1049 family)
MALATHILPNKDNLSIDIQNQITIFLYTAQKKSQFVLGILGVLLVSGVFLVIAPFLHLIVRIANKRISKQLKFIYNWMNDATSKELIEAHLMVERKNSDYKKLVKMNKLIDRNPATMGLSSELNKLILKILDLELALKKAAYPSIDKDLSEQEVNELKDIFSESTDWQDDSLDVYEKYV